MTPALDIQSTSANGSMEAKKALQTLIVPVFPPIFTLITNAGLVENKFLLVQKGTTSSINLPSQGAISKDVQSDISSEENRVALNKLRKLSGLTWEQLASLFKVTRRSLHFWASGQPLSRENEETLNRLLGTIEYIDRGSASTNRSLLLQNTQNGKPCLDLLAEGQHEDVKQILGYGNAPRRARPSPLSPDAIALRMPQRPEELVNALQDPVHYEDGRTRFVKAVRKERESEEKQ